MDIIDITAPCVFATLYLVKAKQAINDKLQGSVATHLKCGRVVNNQIRKGVVLSVPVIFFTIGKYLAKLQVRTWLSRALFRLLAGTQSTATLLFVTLPNIRGFKKKLTQTISNKPFLIWLGLLTTPPHLKYVVTLPCNLSLIACFADANVSQSSVATNARCGGIFNIHFTTNFPRNRPVNSFNRLRLWSWVCGPTFSVHPVYVHALSALNQSVVRFIFSTLALQPSRPSVYPVDR